MRHRRGLRASLTGVLAVGSVLLAAACSSGSTAASSSGTQATAAGGQATTAASGAVRAACAAAQAAEQPVAFKAPGAAVPGPALKGKNIWVIEILGNDSTVQSWASGVQAAGAAVGARVHLFDAGGDVAKANSGVQQAMSQGANVIVDRSVPVPLVAQSLQAARAKGITVVDWANGSGTEPLADGTEGHVSWNYEEVGQLEADEAACLSNGQVDATMLSSVSQTALQENLQSWKREFQKVCPATCKTANTDIPVAQFASLVPQDAVSVLQRDPHINWLFPQVDTMVTLALPQLGTTGALSRVKLGTVDIDQPQLQQLSQGKLAFDIGASEAWQGWMTMDQAIRVLSGKSAAVEQAPLRLITPQIVKQGNLTTVESVFGDSYVAGFEKLWGVG